MLLSLVFAIAQAAQEDPDAFLARVTDARTHEPVAGASIELWTEDGAEPLRLPILLAVVRTGPDGSAPLTYHVSGIRPDKARVTHPGHASRTVSTSDLSDGVELFPAEPLRGRVLDLEGRAVPGAVLRTRETCRHAIPAVETVTDGDGRFALPDCPADEQDAELEVLPRAHIPLAELDVALLRALARRDGSVDVFVAPRAPLALCVRDEHGQPLVHRRIVGDEKPRASAWTDGEGRCTLPPPTGRYVPLWIEDQIGQQQLPSGPIPRSSSLELRPVTPAAAGALGSLQVRIAKPAGAVEWPPDCAIFASDGAVLSGLDAARVAYGPASVRIGGDFTAWEEQTLRFDVGVDPLVIDAAVRSSPLVRAVLPDGFELVRLSVQAGPTSSVLSEMRGEPNVHVPAGLPIVLLVESASGEVRRGGHAPLVSGEEATVDLRPAASLVRAGIALPVANPR